MLSRCCFLVSCGKRSSEAFQSISAEHAPICVRTYSFSVVFVQLSLSHNLVLAVNAACFRRFICADRVVSINNRAVHEKKPINSLTRSPELSAAPSWLRSSLDW